MMASDINWTNDLGNAVLAQRPDVMDAVQRERHRAYQYGYLRTNQQIVVSNGPYIDIEPVNPEFIVVPYYNPVVVYAPPRPGFFVGGAIGFGFGVAIGYLVPSVGLGQQPLRLGQSRRDRQQSPVGPHLGQPPRLRASIRSAPL